MSTEVMLDKSVMDRVNLARFKVKVQTLTTAVLELASDLNNSEEERTAKAFAASLGLSCDAIRLGNVLHVALTEHKDIDLVTERFNAVRDVVKMANWEAVDALGALLIKPKPAVATAPAESATRKVAREFMAGGRGATLPDAGKVEVREPAPVNIEELVVKLMPLLDVNIVQRMDKLKASAAPTKLDERAIHNIVSTSLSKCLSNGHGEAIKDIVQKGGAKMLTELLEKAAAAVSASVTADKAPDATSMVVVPTPDPNYHWSTNLKRHAELANKMRALAPQFAVNLLLLGPTGCGKTTWAREYAAMFKLPFLKLDCPNMREESAWFGVKNANASGTYFTKSQFWRAIEMENIVLAFDEFNRVPDHVRNPLMSLFDHTRCTFHDEGGVLKVGKGATLAAGMNVGMDYTATTTTDRAMKNRFGLVFNIDYLEQLDEVKVLCSKVPGINRDICGKLVEAANTVRAKHKAGTVSDTLSTRQLETAALALQIGGASSFELTVFNHFNNDGEGTTDRGQVIEIFQLKGLLR